MTSAVSWATNALEEVRRAVLNATRYGPHAIARELSGRDIRAHDPREAPALPDDARCWLREDLEDRTWVFTES